MIFNAYETRDMLARTLAAHVVAQLKDGLTSQDRVSLCVTGGSTPGPLFDALAQSEMDWSRVDIFLNDERWVPESSERSNTALVKQRLITGKAASANLVPLYADFPTPEEGLPALFGGIEAVLPITVLVLGMGPDMHTASLFPGADQLELGLSDAAPTLLAMRAPGAVEPRITLSAKALKTAKNTHLLITGDDKRAVLEEAKNLPPREAPISVFLPDAHVHWAR